MDGFWNWTRRWWPGIIPLALLWAAAVWTTTGPVEQDLTARTGAALTNSVLDKTQISVSGRDVALSADATLRPNTTGKLIGLEEGSGLGFVISVMFHWGLGRHAQAGKWPLLVAIGTHLTYNLVAVGLQLLMGDASALVMLVVSGLILWASFQRRVDVRHGAP